MSQSGEHSLTATVWKVICATPPASLLLGLERSSQVSVWHNCCWKPGLAFILGTCHCPPADRAGLGSLGAQETQNSQGPKHTHTLLGSRDTTKNIPQNSESSAFAIGPHKAQSQYFFTDYAPEKFALCLNVDSDKKSFSVRKLGIEKTTMCADTHSGCSSLSWVKSVFQNQSIISSVLSFTGVLARHLGISD